MSVDVRIELETPEVICGGEVRGRFTLDATDAVTCKAVFLEGWCHRGGLPRKEWEDMVHLGSLAPGTHIERAFRGRVRIDGPITYKGKRISFQWAVVVRVDGFLGDRTFFAPFAVVPPTVPSSPA